jgi:preprotein translocase subunit SecB
MPKQVKMKLRAYTVDKMSFMLNKQFRVEPGQKVQIKPIFNREITKVNEQRFVNTVSVSLTNIEQDTPFYLDVQISGVFDVEDWEDPETNKFVIKNATEVLYPYLRTIVTTLTANGHVPPYVLPMANVDSIFH